MAGSSSRFYKGECGLYVVGSYITFAMQEHTGEPYLYESLRGHWYNEYRDHYIRAKELVTEFCLITKRGVIARRSLARYPGSNRVDGFWFDFYHILLPDGRAGWAKSSFLKPGELTQINEDPFAILPKHSWPEILEV